MGLAFISYRRSDSAQATRALYSQLSNRFGPSQFFFDVSAILPGAVWPNRIQLSLENASVVVPVLGPQWITAANEYGQRRLDDPEDWVRKEIGYALDNEIDVLPVLVAGNENMPPPGALPDTLQRLPQYQAMKMRDDSWAQDFKFLSDQLEDRYGFVANQSNPSLPKPRVNISPLDSNELEDKLSELPDWEAIESFMPNQHPKPRQELRRSYEFSSFDAAISFMNSAVSVVDKINHHPRWENQWKTVTVYSSTWDIGHRISDLDTDFAAELDKHYREFRDK